MSAKFANFIRKNKCICFFATIGVPLFLVWPNSRSHWGKVHWYIQPCLAFCSSSHNSSQIKKEPKVVVPGTKILYSFDESSCQGETLLQWVQSSVRDNRDLKATPTNLLVLVTFLALIGIPSISLDWLSRVNGSDEFVLTKFPLFAANHAPTIIVTSLDMINAIVEFSNPCSCPRLLECNSSDCRRRLEQIRANLQREADVAIVDGDLISFYEKYSLLTNSELIQICNSFFPIIEQKDREYLYERLVAGRAASIWYIEKLHFNHHKKL